jgi:hypothetical protein
VLGIPPNAYLKYFYPVSVSVPLSREQEVYTFLHVSLFAEKFAFLLSVSAYDLKNGPGLRV